MSGKVAVSAGLILGEQLAVSPDSVVPFEYQIVTCPTDNLVPKISLSPTPPPPTTKTTQTPERPKPPFSPPPPPQSEKAGRAGRPLE